ncbi:hypothetical protein QAD02_011967 [Eretmocerus hayati]|uniref:Uncharacterized protein n=1 Tax=Eretmocerus hayati TaxID=131215 RepID=A0ACC2P014_9HYME|nr:hypothetical protein QAD02_011967 [Eretmocerus hayati]
MLLLHFQLDCKDVESFSKEIEGRIDELSTAGETEVSMKKQKSTACFNLIQLLKGRLRVGALTKPYTSWLKRNILAYRDQLDGLILYSYPESCGANLKGFKDINLEQAKEHRLRLS